MSYTLLLHTAERDIRAALREPGGHAVESRRHARRRRHLLAGALASLRARRGAAWTTHGAGASS